MNFSPSRVSALVLAMPLVALSVAWLSAQRGVAPAPPLVISSMHGRDLFDFYCASCHGRDGKGHGPVVPALKVPVPDLTTMATRNGGRFPAARVTSTVAGEPDPPPAAHGSRDMPVWGPIFRALDPADTRNKVRIENIVAYVESLQERRPPQVRVYR